VHTTKNSRGAEHFRHTRIRSGPKYRQGYPRHVTNSDGIQRSQLEAFGEQAKDLSEVYIKTASGQTAKPPQSR
jgi:hypothetical protein